MTERPPAPEVAGYTILGRIGAGGMGSVFKARRADGTLAALKVAEPHARISAAEAQSLFRREALATLNLDHENLVRGLDVGTTADGRPYLAMELVEGRSLARALKDDGPLPEAEVLRIAAGLARGLDHAHRLGLVHRDVKPGNVLLGKDGAVKLADLGLVVESDHVEGRRRLGTRGFAAPEVIASGEAGPRSDLFSLGATLAAAVFGPAPRDAADLKLPEEVRGTPLSPGFCAVLQRLLRRDQKERYASAAELTLDLDALRQGDRPLGAILGTEGAARSRARRARRIGLAAAAAAVVAAIAIFALVRGSPTAAPGPEASAPAAEDARLAAARLYLERYPEDFARGRQMLDEAGGTAPSPEDRGRLATLRAGLEERFEAAGRQEFLDREKAARPLFLAGDVAAARAAILSWPAALAQSPWKRKAEETAGEWLARAQAGAEELAAEMEALAEAPAAAGPDAPAAAGPDAPERAAAAVARVDAALSRPAFDGDGRERLAAARARLAGIVDEGRARAAAEAASAAAAAAEARAVGRLKEALAGSADASEIAAALFGLTGPDSAPRLAGPAGRLLDAFSRAEEALTAAVAALRGRTWAGPVGDEIVVSAAPEAPPPRALFGSPLWLEVGGPAAAVVSAAGGREEGAAWLFLHGFPTEAAALSADARALLSAAPAEAPRAPAPGAFGRRVALALREAPPAAASEEDPVLDAWAAAIAGRPRPAPRDDPRAAAAKTEGRDAFLADDFPAAWELLSTAARLSPWDAEVAALRGRVVLTGADPLPTAPALFYAFSEGRRAADLDPTLPAAWALAAEAGVRLVSVAAEPFARRARPLIGAACEEACRLGREDARFLAFAGNWHLDEGRAEKAVALLRRAVAKEPDSGAALLLLARGELACGRRERARDALGRARQAFGGKLPDSAADLARELSK